MRLPSTFLADLDAVCPAGPAGLSSSFLGDLDIAYAHALQKRSASSLPDLGSLAKALEAWRASYRSKLQQLLAKLAPDDPLTCPVSLFATMDYGRLETAHTRALAWLLGDREHGFRCALLEALLRRVDGRQLHLIQVDQVEGEYLTDKGRIDIFARGRWKEPDSEVNWILIVEAKIDAEEGEEQLAQYDSWLENRFQSAAVVRLFLTPDGRGASSPNWESLSFVDLAGIFRSVPGLTDKPGYDFLRYYLVGILRDVCGLEIPIKVDSWNPYAVVDYLRSSGEIIPGEQAHD